MESSVMSQVATGGDAVHRTLQELGVDCVFGIPSQQNLALFDSFRRLDGIRVVVTRHEQAAVHAADGYARATGRLGVAIASTGPGTTNCMTGLYEAAFASSPVLLLTTQVDRIHFGKDRAFVHQADRQTEMLRSVCSVVERVDAADRISSTIVRVAQSLLTGRPQPGAIEIHTDLLGSPAPAVLTPVVALNPLVAQDVEAAADLLGRLERPVLWVGGGAQSASAELVQLAERLQAPVLSTVNGRGVIPFGHPLFVTTRTSTDAVQELLNESDGVVAVGTRFQALATKIYELRLPEHIIHIDADPTVIGRTYRPSIGLVGDARATCRRLLELLPSAPGHRDDGFHDIANATRQRAAKDLDTALGRDHSGIRDALNGALDQGARVAIDATRAGVAWGAHGLTVTKPRTASYSTSLSIGVALGLGIGAAVGAGRTVVIHGDGGIMAAIGELATAVQEDVPVTVCVLNDRGYGTLRALQEAAGMGEYAVDLHTPDFVALGNAMGIPSHLADSVADFQKVLESFVAERGPNLIELDLSPLVPIA